MDATPPPVPADAVESDAPLSEADYLLIREATERRAAIRKAAARARRSASITLVLGIVAVPFVVMWFSWSGAMITVGLLVVGSVEQWGSRLMLAADPAAPKILARNQLAFIGVITIYCVWQMLAFSPEAREQLDLLPSMKDFVADLDRLTPLLMYGFYSLIILLSLFFQGRLAHYYHTRTPHIRTYHTDTPDWVKRMIDETEG